ncbi:MAG: L-threonine 3-dehydrogenase [Alphaproteobacteria bacterium]
MRRAIAKNKPGPGVSCVSLPIPVPGGRDVLVRVKAAAICGTDLHIYHWNAWAAKNVKVPLIIGHEVSGIVEAIGESVTSVKVGDRVAIETHVPCGRCFQCRTGLQHICENMEIIGVHTDGAFSDYALVPEPCIWKLPNSIPFDIGALYEPCGVAMHSVCSADVRASTVAIFGAGPIGNMAIRIARVLGATKVIAVDLCEERLSMAEAAGAEVVLNPSQIEPVAAIKNETTGRGVDVAIELSGSVTAGKQCLEVIRKAGQVVFTGLPSELLEIDLTSDVIYREAKVTGTTGRVMYDTWYQVSALVESGLIDLESIITHRLPLEEVDKAIEIVGEGKGGKVLLEL